MYVLAILTILVSAADHWTTYLCLRSPVAGWQVAEANPLAQWLFDSFGLVPGLLIDSGVTLWAIAFLLTTSQIPKLAKGLVRREITEVVTPGLVANADRLEGAGAN